MAISKPDFGAFGRDLVMRAFDALAAKAESADGAPMTGLQKLADSWRSLSDGERQELAATVTSAAQLAAAALPIALTAARKRVRRRVARRAAAAAAPAAQAVVKKDKKNKKEDKKRKKKDKKKDKKKKKK